MRRNIIIGLSLSICVSFQTLFFVSPALAQILVGDANGDRKVDGQDYIPWLLHYGSPTTNAATDGDFNIDGKVDGVDYILWLNNYGATATITQSPTPTAIPCTTSATTWSGTSFGTQTNNFMISFKATPQAAGITGYVGLSTNTPLTNNDLAVLIRFNADNTIQAYNSISYQSAQSITYSPNIQYTFRVFVNMTNHTFNAYVTPQGGTEKQFAQDYAFRTTQSSATSLGYWTAHATLASDLFQVCTVATGAYSPTPTSAFTPTPQPSCYVKVSGYVYNLDPIVGVTMHDQTSGKTNNHSKSTLQCGTLANPTDMTSVYLEKHTPLGCWQRIAPYSVTQPAPTDPTCV